MNIVQVGIIIWALFIHFIADFVFQTDRMAKEKSKSILALERHVLVYTLVIFVGMIGWAMSIGYEGDTSVSKWIEFSIEWALLNGAVHFCVDFVTSKINARLLAQERVHAFFVGVGADQFIHAATLILTLWALKP